MSNEEIKEYKEAYYLQKFLMFLMFDNTGESYKETEWIYDIDVLKSFKEVIEVLGKINKPLVTGLGHEQDHLMAELFADHICTTPTMVGTWLRDRYRDAKRELEMRPKEQEESIQTYKPRYSDAKFAKYLQPEPTFYGIRWTYRQPVKWVIWILMLIGVLQIVSLFW